MARAQTNAIRPLRWVALLRHGAETTDAQLLESFINERDETAFEVLVRRHGPMVLAVCRRLIGSHHDAEDAFQTTFLVLARKAASVRPRERVANWLHGVAYRTALKVRTRAAWRRGRETSMTEAHEPEAAGQAPWDDVRPLLDRELSGLPERYRLPIVLCDLEGKSIKEATRQLGWPQGTLAGRLARGRKLLAERLANRGVVPAAGALALAASRNAATADVPAALMNATIGAATRIASGQATSTAPASGVREIMLLTKLKIAASLLAVAVGVGSVLYLAAVAAGEPPPRSTQGKPEVPSPARPALAGAPRADKPDPTIADVERAWTARQNEHKSFRVEWVEKYTVKAGEYDSAPGTNTPGPHPPRDAELANLRSFATDGDKHAGAKEEWIYSPAQKTFLPSAFSFYSDGTTSSSMSPNSPPGWTQVRTSRGHKPGLKATGAYDNSDNPIGCIYRPLRSGPFAEFERYAFSGRTQKIRGTTCVEIVSKDALKNDAIGVRDWSLWCDPERGYLPVRQKGRFQSARYDLDFEYRTDDAGRVVPSGWRRTWFKSRNGEITWDVKAEVKKLDLGHKFAADAFSPKLPPGSHVTASEDGDVKEVYLVRPDGSKRPIAAAERRNSCDELSRTNADGTPYVPTKK